MRPLVSIDAARTAVLCVDLQEEHRRDARYLVEGFDRVLEHVGAIQSAARARGVPVMHAAYLVDPGVGPGKPFHPKMPDGRSAFSDIADPNSAICPEVGPRGNEVVLVKADASVFATGSLAEDLRARRIEWLVVVGVWTEACIAATVKDAVESGFRVLLVKDACGSGTAAMHETAILNLANRLYGGAVTDSARACRLLAGEAVEVWQVDGSVPLRFSYANSSELYGSL